MITIFKKHIIGISCHDKALEESFKYKTKKKFLGITIRKEGYYSDGIYFSENYFNYNNDRYIIENKKIYCSPRIYIKTVSDKYLIYRSNYTDILVIERAIKELKDNGYIDI